MTEEMQAYKNNAMQASYTRILTKTTEAAPAAKSEGCQPNHFGLGLGLGYGLGRMQLFVVHYFL